MQLESVILTLVGIVVGAAITAFFSWYWRPYGGRLSVQIFDYIPLNTRLTRHLEGMSISYKGKPISDRMALVRGVVLNDGNRDLTISMIERDVALSLSNGKWMISLQVMNRPKRMFLYKMIATYASISIS